MNSIRRQLLLWQIGALAFTGLLIALVTYGLAWNGFNQVRDYGLEQIAHSVLRHGVTPDPEAGDADEGQFVSQIWNHDGTLYYSSNPAVMLPLQREGLHVLRHGGDEWHLYTVRRGSLFVQVANTTANRAAMFARIMPWLLIPMSVLIALLGSLIWTAVGRALAPLEVIRREIGTRDVPAMHPLETRGLPDEIAPLVAALNELLARLNEALAAQRRFIADAAHELRTPLAAVRLQAQLAGRAEQAADARSALNELLNGVDRASRLVEQLLRAARLEHGARPAALPLRLDTLCKEVVAEFSAMAEAADIDLGVGECPPLTVSGDADALRAMIGNLVDNALRYIPAGGRVDVRLRIAAPDAGAAAGTALLTVDDSGPGIPANEREQVFARFYRLPPAPGGRTITGSGLGLAIVRDIVRLHRGTATLGESPSGGLRVEVRLPGATPANAQATQAAGSP
jgi:two-component system OmpR family sensor kinase